jgi:hypothetical protein
LGSGQPEVVILPLHGLSNGLVDGVTGRPAAVFTLR